MKYEKQNGGLKLHCKSQQQNQDPNLQDIFVIILPSNWDIAILYLYYIHTHNLYIGKIANILICESLPFPSNHHKPTIGDETIIFLSSFFEHNGHLTSNLLERTITFCIYYHFIILLHHMAAHIIKDLNNE